MCSLYDKNENRLHENLLKQTAFIIVNYNTPLLTIEAVHNIIDSNTGIIAIIVDNYSTDDSKEILSREFLNNDKVHLIFTEKNYGYAVGNNIGIDYVKKIGNIRFIGIMNPDVKVALSTISTLANVLVENSNIAFITAKTCFNGKITSPNCCAWRLPTLYNLLLVCTVPAFVWSRLLKKMNIPYNDQKYYDDMYYAGKKIAYVDVVQGCFFMGILQTMFDIGMFDSETFLYYEENIIGVKIKNRRKVNAVVTDELIYHNHHTRDNSLKNVKNKIFAIKCEHESRCHFIKQYCTYSLFFKILLCLLLKIDCKIRIIGCKLLYRLYF